MENTEQTTKIQEQATLISNEVIQGDYCRWRLSLPRMCRMAQPGQFVNIQIPDLDGRILRRPFSICNADAQTGIMTIVFKVIGNGTEHMRGLQAGTTIDVLGPLGHGFSLLSSETPAILIGGGYGCAAMYFAARLAKVPPIVLLGGRSAGDIILADDFRRLGCDVQISTNDGSLGTSGFVTVLLEKLLNENYHREIAACGPLPMLKAVGLMSEKNEVSSCELSIDRIMCCGVGACFGCVLKIKDSTNDAGWKFVRACHEGPVFQAKDIYWE